MMDDEGGTALVRTAKDPADWFEHSLRLLFENVIVQLPNALDPTQIEGIHDMRVATRRLRSALRDIELAVGGHPAKLASKGFKSLADTLGAVRDEDVAINVLEQLAADPNAEHVRSGIELLVQTRRDRREAAFAKLQTELSVDFQQDLRHRFETSLESLLAEIRRSQFADVHAFGSKVVGSLLNELEPLGVRLYDPFDRKTLHNARIATKRLRYAIDLFAECWGDAAKPFSKEFARMQGFLGDAHDRDVWMDDLYRLIKTSKHATTAEDPELEAAAWLISEFIKERTKNYRDALRLWADWQSREFGDALSSLVSGR